MMGSRNRRKERIRRTADNRFTEVTGIEFTKLTGSSDCWICHQTQWFHNPIRKTAFALFNGWQVGESSKNAQRMRLLRVKQSCGVDQCINPAHLVGKEKPFDAIASWGKQ